MPVVRVADLAAFDLLDRSVVPMLRSQKRSCGLSSSHSRKICASFSALPSRRHTRTLSVIGHCRRSSRVGAYGIEVGRQT